MIFAIFCDNGNFWYGFLPFGLPEPLNSNFDLWFLLFFATMAISGMVFCHFGCRDSQASYLGGVFCAFPAMSMAENRCANWWSTMCHCQSALFKIVLGLMCPGGLCRGGKSQNEAKSRRFGMDMPCRAFYEGLIPKRFGTRLFGHSHHSQSAKNTPSNCHFLNN